MAKTTRTRSSSGRTRFDRERALLPEQFFARYLVHIKGEWAGLPLTLEKWQARLLRELFGRIGPDGLRRYRTCYVEVPRKNGKSTMAAGIALYLLFADGEPGAEIYSAAADREQAAIVFGAAKEMVERSPKLRKRCEVYQRSIVVPSTGSCYKVLSADVPTKHGLNPHGIIFDELHAQPNRHLWDVLTTGTAARRQPLTIAITTAGFDRHSVCFEQHEYAEKVRDGVIPDDSFLPVIYAAAKDDDWKDPKVWKKANPNLGVSVKAEYLGKQAKKAAEVPAEQNSFRRLHLNQWTEQDLRWMPMEVWDACADPLPELVGRECFGGLDLSSTLDLSAFVLAFVAADRVDVLCRFWVPREGARKRADHDRVPYPLWIDQGFIEATEGDVIDYDVIRERIKADGERYDIREIAFDRWNATQLSIQLAGDGFTMVEVGMGFASMAAPTKELMNLVLGRKLRHGGHPVLRWCASNISVEQDAAGNWKPSKRRSSEKIDGIVALILAVSRLMLRREPERSVYETRGILTI